MKKFFKFVGLLFMYFSSAAGYMLLALFVIGCIQNHMYGDIFFNFNGIAASAVFGLLLSITSMKYIKWIED